MKPNSINTVADLRTYLYRAMQLEHATIPPYLSALYSIHPGKNSAVTQVLRTVVVEEMLHLTIVANLLNAVGGIPDLTGRNFVLRYPTFLPDGEMSFKVDLGKFSEATLDTFLLIEQPIMARAGQNKTFRRNLARGEFSLASCPLDPEVQYISIGEFYAEIERGLDYLFETQGPCLFCGDAKRQITREYYYSGGGRLFSITDIETAREGLRQIVEQGEGAGGGIYDHDKELAHYYRFQELKLGRYYEAGNSPGNPTGPTLSVDWTAVYPTIENARVRDYRDAELRSAAVDFNRFYARLLALLTRAFNGEPALLQDTVPMMFEIGNRMTQLMRYPMGDGSDCNAAPTFEIDLFEEVV